jgi:hypothetical protein
VEVIDEGNQSSSRVQKKLKKLNPCISWRCGAKVITAASETED